MGRRTGVLAGLAVFAASACSGAPGTTSAGSLALESTSPLVVAGTCLTGARLGDSPDHLADAISAYGLVAYQAMDDDPIWTDAVDCAEPHSLEIYAAVTLPEVLDDEISSYRDLLDPSPELSRSIQDSVGQQCAAALEPAASVLAATSVDVDILPMLTPSLGRFSWNPAPPKAWNSGDRTIGCLFEQSTPGTIVASELSDGRLPLDQRTCLDGGTFVSCKAPHTIERLATLVVDRAVAAQQLAGMRAVDETGAVNLGDKQWEDLDSICQNYLAAVSDHPTPGLRGVADTYPELYPDEVGHYRVLCNAQSRFGTSPRDMTVSVTSVFEE